MMGKVWFCMIVAVSLGHVLAVTRDCSEEAVEEITKCDECIRCGATWCNDRNAKPRCRLSPESSWCSNRLKLLGLDEDLTSDQSSIFTPQHYHKFITVGEQKSVEFVYHGMTPNLEPEITFVNSSIPGLKTIDPEMFDIQTETSHKNLGKGVEYKTMIKAKPTHSLCPASGRTKEFITLKLEEQTMGGDAATMTFEIPCACDCSFTVEVKSASCNGRGNYSCDYCTCEKGWKGKSCEIKETHCERGDIDNCRNLLTNEICSNNGICTCEGTCQCDMEVEGSQYFDNVCSDICTSTSYCDSCLLNPPPHGQCKDCQNIFIEYVDRSRLNETDQSNRKVWMPCTEKTDSCTVEYVAMKDASGITHLMILEPCNAIVAAATADNTLKITVPAILGVIALVAATAALAGYMVWKNRTPPLPLSDPGYQNIGAEDCTGENPLYKPPTSSFKNPTYGKW